MTKLFCIFIAFCTLFCETASGQNYAQIDSLKKELNAAKSDTMRANLNCLLSHSYWRFASDTGLIYGKQGLALARKANEEKYIALALLSVGRCYGGLGEYPGALTHLRQSRTLFEALGDKKKTASAFLEMGNLYQEQGDFPQALKNYQESLKLYKAIGDQKLAAYLLSNIGNVYESQKDLAQALNYYQASFKSFEKLNDKQGLGGVSLNIGNIYLNQKDFRKALDAYQKSRAYYEAVGDETHLADALINIAVVYCLQNDFQLALEYYAKAQKIVERTQNPFQIIGIVAGIGDVHLKNGRPKEALPYNTEALEIARQIGLREKLMDLYNLRSKIDSALGDSRSALAHYKLSISYRDSLFNEEKTKEMGKLEGKYEIEKAQEAEKRKQEAITKATQRQNNLQYLLIFAGVAVFFLGLFFIGKLKLPLVLSEGIIFLAFLMLFEYILIVTEPFLDKYTGGVPIQKLGLNILLAGIFTPLHRFLEGKLKKQLINKE